MFTAAGIKGKCELRRVWTFTCMPGAIILALILSGCRPSSFTSAGSWKTYSNSRYGFEFLYPSNWVAAPPPEDQDGQAFTLPQNPAVEIRGWASNQYALQKNKAKSLQSNFKTKQGLAGQLKVKIGPEQSSMTLTLNQGQFRYSWQGQAPSQQFDNYYRFFYYTAVEYQVSQPKEK